MMTVFDSKFSLIVCIISLSVSLSTATGGSYASLKGENTPSKIKTLLSSNIARAIQNNWRSAIEKAFPLSMILVSSLLAIS
jgi:hypothetical protein